MMAHHNSFLRPLCDCSAGSSTQLDDRHSSQGKRPELVENIENGDNLSEIKRVFSKSLSNEDESDGQSATILLKRPRTKSHTSDVDDDSFNGFDDQGSVKPMQSGHSSRSNINSSFVNDKNELQRKHSAKGPEDIEQLRSRLRDMDSKDSYDDSIILNHHAAQDQAGMSINDVIISQYPRRWLSDEDERLSFATKMFGKHAMIILYILQRIRPSY